MQMDSASQTIKSFCQIRHVKAWAFQSFQSFTGSESSESVVHIEVHNNDV